MSLAAKAARGTDAVDVELSAPVWRGKYLQATPGRFVLAGGRVRFETTDKCWFDVPLSELTGRVRWPWYSFSGAVELQIDGGPYFLSFLPRNATTREWYAGLMAGRQWRAALAGRPMPVQPPLGLRIARALLNLALGFIFACGLLLALAFAMDSSGGTLDRWMAGVMAAGQIAMAGCYVADRLQSWRRRKGPR